MNIHLPDVIARFFLSDTANDAEGLARCFTVDAVVKDDGETRKGHDAIRDWKREYTEKYNSTVEPIAMAEDCGHTVVTGHVQGDFPGSPVDLRYVFTLDSGKISALEITA
ncbi:nuclear transport factor 2 family protein [Sphingobium sufflavum]|uniref:nuclear transport factor 2 family protein n=1 Tax=Sphingobium sufflavum TaxID=1129547 RepID=UPI001F23D0A3|nr:nuclear transport factor 2 family protein [Sphingobium sufflavum]MCE7796733.1 nuclear transport factor 2 family protein [Sphingobium sufflavum]